jgi:hypothetical protein
MFPPRAEALPKPAQIDRRGLLCGLAAVPAVAALPSPAPLAGPAASPDPIFAAIEAFRVAAASFEQVLALAERDLEAGVISNQERWNRETGYYEDVYNPLLDDLISTTPTTLAGLAAVLGFMREQGGTLDAIGADFTLMATFERSLECAVCSIAGLPVPPISRHLVDGGEHA